MKLQEVGDKIYAQHIANQNNLIGFARRYAELITGFLVFLTLVLVPGPYTIFGTLLYFPLFGFAVVLVALLMRFMFFRKTLDEDAHSGYFVAQWQLLDAKTRILASLGFVAVMILSFSILASALIR